MRAVPKWLLLALLPAFLGGCSDDGGGQPDAAGPPLPFFDVATVKTWPEVRNCRFSIEHDGVQIAVYASPAAATAYTEGTYPFAEGTVIVKAEHDDDACAELVGFTAMRKLAPGTAPMNGDWEWQRVDPSGEVVESALIPVCVSCHSDCTNDRDFTCTDP
jgi:hypothetical protein